MTCTKSPGPRSVPSGDEFATEQTGADDPGKGSIEIDMKVLIIESYLNDLGPESAALDRATLVGACQCVLDGRGPPDLKDHVVATISWQTLQMQRVSQLLDLLAKSGLITDIVDPSAAQKAASEHWEDILVPIMRELDKYVRCLETPPEEGHVRILFNDASLWLTQVLAYNKIQYPEGFDIKPIKSEVGAFFAPV